MKFLTFEKDFVWPFNYKLIKSITPLIIVLQILNGAVIFSYFFIGKLSILFSLLIILITFLIQSGIFVIEIKGLRTLYKNEKYKSPNINYILKKIIQLFISSILPFLLISFVLGVISLTLGSFIASGVTVLRNIAYLGIILYPISLIYFGKKFQFLFLQALENFKGPLTTLENAVILSNMKGSWKIFLETILVGIFYGFTSFILTILSNTESSIIGIITGICLLILSWFATIHPLSVLVKGYNKLVSSNTK